MEYYYKHLPEEEKRYSLEKFGVECGSGWKPLYVPVVDFVSQWNKENSEENQIYIHQIKEKWGGLRIYCSKYVPDLQDIIKEAETLSYKTCEQCGKPGECKPTRNWYRTLCPVCRKLREICAELTTHIDYNVDQQEISWGTKGEPIVTCILYRVTAEEWFIDNFKVSDEYADHQDFLIREVTKQIARVIRFKYRIRENKPAFDVKVEIK